VCTFNNAQACPVRVNQQTLNDIQAYALKESRRIAFPINNIIDEAQDIFNAAKAFRDAAETMLDDNVRKSRSLHIGFTICVQAADAIPERILNNLNTRIIHRHNSHDQLRVAADMATDEQRRMTKRFGRGEAFINVLGANSIVHARINRAPFMLTKFKV
jgi:DNA helicase HerA-like ATPase